MVERRTGATSAQLAALPDGSAYLVAFEAERRYCQSLLVFTGRRWDALRIVTLADFADRLRGLPRATVFDVDHAIYDWEFATPHQWAVIRMYQCRFALPDAAAAPADGG